MQLGFAIDQRTCIGCHACTVACKTEHETPVGQFRTWVKYVDSNSFPDTTRSFGVMRCNHCTDAPCVKICPTESLFKRPDGIVDFDCAEHTPLFGEGGGARLAETIDAPLLGQIPLDLPLRTSGDLGVPAMVAAPTAAPVMEIRRIASGLPVVSRSLVGRSLPLSVV